MRYRINTDRHIPHFVFSFLFWRYLKTHHMHMQGDFTACKNNELQMWCCMCFASSISFSASLVFCISGGGRDLDGKPGAVLQTLLRVHVQHLIIDSSPSPASPFLSSVKRHTLISLLPHLIVGQSPPRLSTPLKNLPVSSYTRRQVRQEGYNKPVTLSRTNTHTQPSMPPPPWLHHPTQGKLVKPLTEFGTTSR